MIFLARCRRQILWYRFTYARQLTSDCGNLGLINYLAARVSKLVFYVLDTMNKST